MVQQTDFEDNTSHDSTQACVDFDITSASVGQFENEIHLAANTREASARKLSSSQTSISPERKVSNNAFTTPEKKESLSTSVLSYVSRKPVEGTPRTSTPEPRKSMSPRVGQQRFSGFHHDSLLSNVESHVDRTKQFYDFYDSTATNGINSTHDLNDVKVDRPLSDFTTQQPQRDDFTKKQWYFDILQRMEDLSWSYQNLEVEYSFLERLMAEQKEDLRKAKSWSKHLKSQNSSSTGRANKTDYR